jgi:hypothetical protein
MTNLVLLEPSAEAPLSYLLDSLGATFERRSLGEVLARRVGQSNGGTALILSDEQLLHAHNSGRAEDLVARHRYVLVYPFRGTPGGLRALQACTGGRVSAEPLDHTAATYLVAPGAAGSGPFAGLTVTPANAATDCRLVIRESLHRIEPLVAVRDGGLFTKIVLPTGELFVTSSSAVFDVDAEVVKNLEVQECFSALVPLIFFLRHSGAPFWRTSRATASIIIDDLNLRPRYGFVNVRTLAGHVDQLSCAVSIAFIPWNCDRTSRAVVELFRSRWPRLSLCIHGCDHVGAEFATGSPAASQPMIALSLDRMRSLKLRTRLEYDRVMVFPQGRFSAGAMEALRQSDFLAAVNTELIDHRTARGVRAGELLRPAITSYAGFPLFLRRKPATPIANFALDLLLGKPCLVVTHHDDFQRGMQPFVSLVTSLTGLEPGLRWSNLETIVSRTYATRVNADSTVDVRLFASSTILAERPAQMSFQKAEPLVDRDFEIRLGDHSLKSYRDEADLVFQGAFSSEQAQDVHVRASAPPVAPAPPYPVSRRIKVAARRYLSEFRDNYVAKSPWATAAVQLVHGSALTPEQR